MAEAVKQKLPSHNIELGSCACKHDTLLPTTRPNSEWIAKKDTRKQLFIVYYSSAVKQQLESGKLLEDVDVDFCLTVIKPLHAQRMEESWHGWNTRWNCQVKTL